MRAENELRSTVPRDKLHEVGYFRRDCVIGDFISSATRSATDITSVLGNRSTFSNFSKPERWSMQIQLPSIYMSHEQFGVYDRNFSRRDIGEN